MNLTFYYVLADWEELAYDNRVLENMLFKRDFKISNRKYYLANAGYHNMDYLLCAYCNVCYNFKEQTVARKKLVNKKELFNLCHLSLCNVVERIF